MFLNDGMQVQQYLYDFSADGGAISTIDLSAKENYSVLPAGSIVLNCVLAVETTFTSGGSATLDVGNGDDPNGYLAGMAVADLSANSVFTAAQQAGALLWDNSNDAPLAIHVDDSADGQVTVDIATATMTAGKARVFVFCVKAIST